MKCRSAYIRKVKGLENVIEIVDGKIGGYNCFFLPSRSNYDGIWHARLGYVITSIQLVEEIMYRGHNKEVWK